MNYDEIKEKYRFLAKELGRSCITAWQVDGLKMCYDSTEDAFDWRIHDEYQKDASEKAVEYVLGQQQRV